MDRRRAGHQRILCRRRGRWGHARGVARGSRGRQVYEWLTDRPGVARLRGAHAAVAALGLELRDFSGNEVPTKSVMIQEVRPPDWIPAAAIAQTVAEALEEGMEIAIPSFIVIVLLVRRAREHGPLSRDRA